MSIPYIGIQYVTLLPSQGTQLRTYSDNGKESSAHVGRQDSRHPILSVRSFWNKRELVQTAAKRPMYLKEGTLFYWGFFFSPPNVDSCKHSTRANIQKSYALVYSVHTTHSPSACHRRNAHHHCHTHKPFGVLHQNSNSITIKHYCIELNTPNNPDKGAQTKNYEV